MNNNNVLTLKSNSKTYQILEPKTSRSYMPFSKKKGLNSVRSIKKDQDEQIKLCYMKDSKLKKTRHKNINRTLLREKMQNRSVGSLEAVGSQE